MSRPAQLCLVLVVYALGAKIALSSGAALDVPRLVVGGAALLAVAARSTTPMSTPTTKPTH
jgi:1,4-dihydroxy-2-naphthoate octaprenyltransferase